VTKKQYLGGADEVFRLIQPSPSKPPMVKTRGFAIAAHELVWRYPWSSVDSSSWVKAAANGIVYVPRKYQGQFRFDRPPRLVKISNVALQTLDAAILRRTQSWLEHIGKPYDPGVATDYHPRCQANLRYFARVEASVPRPFRLFYSGQMIAPHCLRLSWLVHSRP